ncbi:MAG: hypothetical protein AAGC70_13075 [Pseudomonadota bacterium]
MSAELGLSGNVAAAETLGGCGGDGAFEFEDGAQVDHPTPILQSPHKDDFIAVSAEEVGAPAGWRG